MAKAKDDTVYLPTPHVGQALQFYRGGRNEPIAAQCTRVEAPGQIQVVVFAPDTPHSYKKGVLYAKDPLNDKNQAQIHRAGTWDFIPGQAPRDALEFHKKEVLRREQLAKMAAEKAKAEAENAKEMEKLSKERDALLPPVS